MLKLLNVSKKYKNEAVFDSVSIDMSNPGLYIFVGINGSGKSTILKILANIVYKTDGKIIKDISVSYLPDKFSLPKLMKSNDYINTILKLNNVSDDPNKLISLFQIPNRRIGDLSKGNLQKIGLLQVLYNNADCYILDEPLDGLDDYAKKLLKDIIKDLIDNGKIIIMSLHNKQFFNDLEPITYEIRDGLINKKNKKRRNLNEEEKDNIIN